MTITAETITAFENRAAAYRFIASLWYKELTVEQIELFAANPLSSGLEEDADDPFTQGARRMDAYIAGRSRRTRQELAVDYARAILAAGSYEKRCATPYESVFTSEQGLLMQEARDQVVHIYMQWDMEVDQSLGVPDDHLSFELEFMAHMCDKAVAAAREGSVTKTSAILVAQLDFIETHLLNWIDPLVEALNNCAQTEFYLGLGALTKGFIQDDKTSCRLLLEDVLMAE